MVPKAGGRIFENLTASDILSPGGGGVGTHFGIISMHFNQELFQCVGVIESLDMDPRANNNSSSTTFNIPYQGWQGELNPNVYPEYANQMELFE
jgi:hypothetical protein